MLGPQFTISSRRGNRGYVSSKRPSTQQRHLGSVHVFTQLSAVQRYHVGLESKILMLA